MAAHKKPKKIFLSLYTILIQQLFQMFHRICKVIHYIRRRFLDVLRSICHAVGNIGFFKDCKQTNKNKE